MAEPQRAVLQPQVCKPVCQTPLTQLTSALMVRNCNTIFWLKGVCLSLGLDAGLTCESGNGASVMSGTYCTKRRKAGWGHGNEARSSTHFSKCANFLLGKISR